jgi:hypothetical protein
MQMDHEGVADGVVHGGLDGRTLALGQGGGGQVVFDLLLAFSRISAVGFRRNHVQ